MCVRTDDSLNNFTAWAHNLMDGLSPEVDVWKNIIVKIYRPSSNYFMHIFVFFLFLVKR